MPNAVATSPDLDWCGIDPGPQFGERERQRAPGPQGCDDRDRHDRLARPAGPVVDVQGHPRRQEDDLGRHRRKIVPLPFAEQRQPDAGKDAAGLDPAVGDDERARPGHVRRVDLVARQAERRVGLDRGRQVAGTGKERGPRAVVALLGPDPPRRLRELVGGQDAQELAQQQILGIHRHVGAQLAFPPTLGRLAGDQVLPRAHDRVGDGVGGNGTGRRAHVVATFSTRPRVTM